MKTTGHIFTWCLFLICIRSTAFAQDATKIVEEMAKSYSMFEIFECSGKFQPNPGQEFPFNIYFSRPDKLRIDWVSIHPYAPLNKKDPMLIVSNRGKTVMSNPGGEMVKAKSLSMAIASHTGISGGVSHTVPRMLLPNALNGVHPLDLINLEVTGEETINGNICYEISGLNPVNKKSCKLYIGKNDTLLHRHVSSTGSVQDFEMIKHDTTIDEGKFNMKRYQ